MTSRLGNHQLLLRGQRSRPHRQRLGPLRHLEPLDPWLLQFWLLLANVICLRRLLPAVANGLSRRRLILLYSHCRSLSRGLVHGLLVLILLITTIIGTTPLLSRHGLWPTLTATGWLNGLLSRPPSLPRVVLRWGEALLFAPACALSLTSALKTLWGYNFFKCSPEDRYVQQFDCFSFLPLLGC